MCQHRRPRRRAPRDVGSTISTVTDALLDWMGTVACWHGPDGITWVQRDSFVNALDVPDAPESQAFAWHTQGPTGLCASVRDTELLQTGKFHLARCVVLRDSAPR